MYGLGKPIDVKLCFSFCVVVANVLHVVSHCAIMRYLYLRRARRVALVSTESTSIPLTHILNINTWYPSYRNLVEHRCNGVSWCYYFRVTERKNYIRCCFLSMACTSARQLSIRPFQYYGRNFTSYSDIIRQKTKGKRSL